MTLHDLLTKFASYNQWANQKIIDWLNAYPESTLSSETSSSYPTIAKTLNHIWAAQLIYLAFLEEKELKFPENPGHHEITEGLLASSSRLISVIESLGSEGIKKTRYVERPGIKGDFPAFEFILQCLNHSTHHRGQVITMGRSLGMDSPPVTDYYRYSLALSHPGDSDKNER